MSVKNPHHTKLIIRKQPHEKTKRNPRHHIPDVRPGCIRSLGLRHPHRTRPPAGTFGLRHLCRGDITHDDGQPDTHNRHTAGGIEVCGT